jgi:hypothetical protein
MEMELLFSRFLPEQVMAGLEPLVECSTDYATGAAFELKLVVIFNLSTHAN